MTHYYYSPYNDEKMKRYASALVRAKSNNSIITSHRLTDDLSLVGHLDRLYVLIHGGEGGGNSGGRNSHRKR